MNFELGSRTLLFQHVVKFTWTPDFMNLWCWFFGVFLRYRHKSIYCFVQMFPATKYTCLIGDFKSVHHVASVLHDYYTV